MSIPLLPRLIDFNNLIIAKGSNFLLTAVLFWLLSRGMDAPAFAEFGYWWSIALMIGGIGLGGLSSSLIRVTAMHGTLRHLGGHLRQSGVTLLAIALTLLAALLAWPQARNNLLLLAALALFGLVVQLQTAVVALLRAAEATAANLAASVLILLLVPVSLHLLLGTNRALVPVFFGLAAAFTAGTIAGLLAARRAIGHLVASTNNPAPPSTGFIASVASFTAVNVFSYSAVSADFTLFRLIGTPSDFTLMATAKVFFERFVLPVLLVLAGAVSMRVLRHPHGAGAAAARLEAHFTPGLLAGVAMLVGGMSAAYTAFATEVRGESVTVPWLWTACASAGYVLYAANGVLFDVLVMRRTLCAVVAHVVGFLLLGASLQAVAIGGFGVPGWAVGWLVFNAIVGAVLAREGLDWRFSGWSGGKA